MNDSDFIQEFLKNPSSKERIRILETFRDQKKWIPLSLTQDLMRLRLNDEEHIAILRATNSKNSLAFEDFITRNISQWNQNISSAALWDWALRSDRLLWHRMVPISLDPHLSQRLSYTLLDLAWCGGGYHITEIFANKEGLEEMSPAFLALLFFRALQWNVHSDRLILVAQQEISKTTRSLPERTLPYYLAYLYRFSLDWSKDLLTSQAHSEIWSQFHRSAFSDLQNEVRLKNLELHETKSLSSENCTKILNQWPMIWERHKIKVSTVTWFLDGLSRLSNQHQINNLWEFFAGIPGKTLIEALKSLESESAFLYAIRELNYLLDDSHHQEVQVMVRHFLKNAKDIQVFLEGLPKRFSAFTNSQLNGKSPFDLAFQEQNRFLNQKNKNVKFVFEDLGFERSGAELDDRDRTAFFDLAYRQADTKNIALNSDKLSYWSALTNAWIQPEATQLDALSNLARQMPWVYQLCYLDTLGRFSGIDNAALKLLDYIRSTEEDVLRSVVYALAGIKTNRATQELVAFLTRPNASFGLQMEITQLLQEADLSRLQLELRSAISDIRPDMSGENPVWELQEALASLLTIEEPRDTPLPIESSDQPTTEDLDRHLKQKIPSYDLLSGEARRALRTAQFFHLQVSSSGNLQTIDLSPAIDMQYKALELSFREKFEMATTHLVREGILQRKLDVIGYARPIPRAMDEFERYIENLPIINNIPFFSRFKLRKMLRAICQFRPGKRFTLDGLKAFALFFICFSRKKCRYGLENLLPVPSMTETELLNFCRALHIFQDFRNRAAHEGFHPDASNDLDGIWNNTSTIIEGMIHVEMNLREHFENKSTRKTG